MDKIRLLDWRLFTAGVCTLLLSSCSHNETAPKNGTAASSTTTAIDATSTNTPTSPPSSTPTTVNANDTKSGASPTAPNSPVSVNLGDLPDDFVICTIGTYPLKIAEYRTALKVQQLAVQQQLQNDPTMRASLAAAAKALHVSLTDEERKRLVDAAKAARGTTLAAFLKEHKLSEKDFEDAVADEGLQFKTAEMQVEHDLLGQLVRRSILAQNASGNGFDKDAKANVAKIEQTPQFKDLQTQTGLGQHNLHEELMQTELARLQLQRIVQGIKVADNEVQAYYTLHKNELKHGDRIRLSSILVAAPDKDFGAVKSVREQVKQANPKLAGKELDTAVSQVMTSQQNKAMILLTEARMPKADFTKLANQNTDDGTAHAKQNGGDMGWSEKTQLTPVFADAIWKLTPGEVLPKLIKTDEGFRIFKVTGKEKSGALPLSDVKVLIAEKLKQDRAAQVIQEWLARQDAKMPVKFTDRFLQLAKQSQPAK